MICVSLAEESISACREALRGVSFAEIRLDLMPLTIRDVETLFSDHRRLIATCRPGNISEEDRKELLLAAIESGAAYVDVEVESPPGFRGPIVEMARSRDCRVIISYHNHEKTPGPEHLEATVASCYEAGAHIAKIACTVHSDQDNARLLGLIDRDRPIVVIGMGQKGRITRIAAPLLGSPFTFAALSKGKETAEGQMDKETLQAYIRELAKAAGIKVNLDG